MPDVNFSPSEFEQLPLDYVITAPLMATINAHKLAAETTLNYIKELSDEDKNQTFKQKITSTNPDGEEPLESTKEISVPLLALTKVPNLSVDSLSVDFEYAIAQVHSEKKGTDVDGELKLSLPKFLSVFADIGLKGGVTSSKSMENTINKSGTLHIKLHMSEGDYPEGLRKVVDWLTQGIEHNISQE